MIPEPIEHPQLDSTIMAALTQTLPPTSVVYAPKEAIESPPQFDHCPLCLPDKLFGNGDDRPTAIIFLDMDGVMIFNRHRDPLRTRIFQTIHKIFPNLERTSDYHWAVAKPRHLSPNSLAQLDDLIGRTEAAGFRALIVLSTAWRNDATLKQHTEEAYTEVAFGSRICGKISPERSDTSWTPECEMGFDFVRGAEQLGLSLNNRGDCVEYWLRDHGLDPESSPFVILDDCEMGQGRFGSHFVKVGYNGFDETITHRALDALGVEKARAII